MTAPSASPTPSIRKAQNHVQAVWVGGQQFDTGRPGGPVARIDGDAKSGQSPVDALLSALAACTSIDVVEILAKRRTPVRGLRVDAVADRVNATPAKIARIQLVFHIDGETIERAHAERAAELSVTKYCSVRDSIDPAIPVEWTIVLNRE